MSSLVMAGLATAVLLPMLLAAGLWLPGMRRPATVLAPWAALPAVALAFASPFEVTTGWDWLLLGLRLRVADTVARAFLVLTSCLWLAAGLYGKTYMAGASHRSRFESFFLLTLAGNVGVVLAADVVSFYLFYALMTVAAYGLVVHDRTDAARRAGRVYLVMALGGEMLLLGAFFAIVGPEINTDLRDVPDIVATSPRRDLLVGLLLAGFGVKAGALLLHLWLPLAHPVAPTPASAVLSGAMIKAGLLGWLRFLPIGVGPLPQPGLACILAGCGAAFYGILVGLTQRDPKTVLAYSSISQMGFMTVALGIGLVNPHTADAAVSAILFYALHHALAKGALFLGTGVAKRTGGGWPRRLVTAGLALAALDIAGAPLSSGALAKISIKALALESAVGATWLPALLSVGAVGSTLLMISFLLRTVPRGSDQASPRPGLWVPWACVLVLDVALLVDPPVPATELTLLVQPTAMWGAVWPVVVGSVIAATTLRLGRRRALPRASIPPGDVICLLDQLGSTAKRAAATAERSGRHMALRPLRSLRGHLRRLPGRLLRLAQQGEDTLGTFEAVGLLLALLGLVVAVMLVDSR
jgi:formate hydrogenlyase subunit 3/multisubunit Na+/H+ antiporter MnhD subunit